MSTLSVPARRPVGAISGQALALGACAVVAAVSVGALGLQSRHTFLYGAVPVLLAPFALWLFFSKRYEVTLAVLLVYLGVIDGVLRLTSGSSVATLGRDVLLYSIALGFVVRAILAKAPLRVPPFTGIVVAWVAICVMQLANPSNISFLHALGGLRQHLEFVPLFFLGYAVLRSERRLVGLLLLLLVVAAANGIANLIQVRLSPQQLASWGPGYADLVNGTLLRVPRIFWNSSGQAMVRPPGLGGTDGFGGFVCLMALPGAIALLSSARRAAKLSWLLIPATILTIVGIVTSQTRVDIVGGVIALVAFLALTLTSRRGVTALVLTTLIALGGYFTISLFVSTRTTHNYSSIAPSKIVGTAVTARKSNLELIPTYFAKYPLGGGIGSVGPAGGSTFGGKAGLNTPNAESEFTFLLGETGIPGLLVMLVFTLVVIRAGIMLRRIADPALQRGLMALTAVLISVLATWFFGPPTASPPASPFIWLSAGCLAYWYAELRAGRLVTRARRVQTSLALR